MGSTPQYITDAAASSSGSLLKLQPHGATPPVNAYVASGQFLHIKIWSDAAGITVQITAQILLPNGSISVNEWQFNPTTVRGLNQFFQPLTEGFLLGVYVQGNVLGSQNRCFVQCALCTAGPGVGVNISLLCQGYMNVQSALSWPPGTIENSLDGAGAPIDVTGTLPSAGAEINETVPNAAIWQLKAFTFKLTTSATAANRIPHLIIDDGTNVLLDAPAPSVLAASSTNRYVTGDNAIAAAAVDLTQWLQSVAGIKLLAGYRIRTLTTNLQAGDQYTAPQYYMNEWFTS